jgi:hypothetical protein
MPRTNPVLRTRIIAPSLVLLGAFLAVAAFAGRS